VVDPVATPFMGLKKIALGRTNRDQRKSAYAIINGSKSSIIVRPCIVDMVVRRGAEGQMERGPADVSRWEMDYSIEHRRARS